MTQRVLRFFLYLGMGLVIAVLIGVTAWYFPSSTSKMISGGSVWLIIFTPIIFWYPARQHKHLWRLPSFWVTLSGLLVLHFILFASLFRNFPVRPFWLLVIAGVEVVLISILLDAIMPRARQARRHASQE